MPSDSSFLEQAEQGWQPNINEIAPPVTTLPFLPGLGNPFSTSSPVGEAQFDLAASSRLIAAEISNSLDTTIASQGEHSGNGDFITGLSASSALAAPDGADLMSIAFDSSIDHVFLGQTTATFVLQNQGLKDAGAFDVDIVYSNDDIVGNEDGQVIQTVTIPGLSIGEVLTRNVELQLPVEQLNTNALAKDGTGEATGYA